MPATNVKTKWVGGNLVFYDPSGNEIATWDGGNRELSFPSGSTLAIESGATFSIADGTLELPDIAVAQGSILVGDSDGEAAALSAKGDGKILVGNGTTITSVSVSGDATFDNTGALTIAMGAVENSMLAGSITSDKLANGAGLASLIAAGLGASASYAKTTTGAQTLLAANGNGEGARTVLITVVVDETFAAGDGSATDFDIGETDATTKFKEALATGTAGDVLTYAGSLTEEKALLITGTAATGTGTGGISVTVLALPASV